MMKRHKVFYAVFVGFCVILQVSRRSGAILHARFYAEDGQFWYADAYNHSFLSNLVRPDNGYLLTLQRLLAQIDVLFPLKYAPLFFNICALLIQTIPILYLLSNRLSSIFEKEYQRVILCLVYVAMPNSFEVSLNLTNSNWRLALLSILILIAKTPKTKWQALVDTSIFTMTCLTGPFAIFLLPFALYKLFTERNKFNVSFLSISIVGLIIQGYFVRQSKTTLFPRGIFYAAKELIKVFNGQVIIGAILGMNTYNKIYKYSIWNDKYLQISIFLFGAFLFGWVFFKSNSAIRCLILFGLIIMASGNLSIRPGETSAMSLMTAPGSSVRFEYILIFSFFVSILWLIFNDRNLIMKTIAVALLLLAATIGIPGDWFFPAFSSYDFYHYVAIFNKAKKDSIVSFPIYPEPWKVILIKH